MLTIQVEVRSEFPKVDNVESTVLIPLYQNDRLPTIYTDWCSCYHIRPTTIQADDRELTPALIRKIDSRLEHRFDPTTPIPLCGIRELISWKPEAVQSTNKVPISISS